MLKLLTRSWLLICCVSAYSWGQDFEVICPCEVTTISDTALKVNFKLARHFAEEEEPDIDVRVAGKEFRFDGSYYYDAFPIPIATPPLGEVNDYSVLLPIARGSSQQEFSQLIFGNGKYGIIQLTDPVPRTSDYGWVNKDSSILMMETTGMTLDGERLNVAVPPIYNFGESSIDNLVMRIYLIDPNYGSYYRIAEETLSSVIAAGSSTSQQSWEINFDSSRYASRATRFALSVGKFDESGEYVEYLRDYALDRQDATADLSLAYTSVAVAFFTDEDADGLTEYNESLFGTRNGVEDVVTHTMKVSFVSSEESVARSEDLSAEIEHVVAHANSVFEASNVNTRLELISIVEGGSESNREITCDDPFECLSGDLLDDLQGARATYQNTDTLEADGLTDVIVGLFDATPPTAHDGSFTCGTARVSSVIGNEMPRAKNAGGYRETVVGLPSAQCPSSTLVHELGHIGGLGHSKKQGDIGKTGYARGYGVSDEFATTMAYPSEFNTTRVDSFSSPSLLCRGYACGVERTDVFNGADASYVLNQTMPYVATYAGGFPPVIELEGDLAINLSVGDEFQESGYTAFDQEDGDISDDVLITVFDKNGQEVSRVDSSQVGFVFGVNYSVTDIDLNESRRKRTVTIVASAIEPEAPDLDGDGIPDSDDTDIDGDGRTNEVDMFPKDRKEWYDSDGDGVGDNEDRIYDPEEIYVFDLLNRSNECAKPYSMVFEVDGIKSSLIGAGYRLQTSLAKGGHVIAGYDKHGSMLFQAIKNVPEWRSYGFGCNWEGWTLDDFLILTDSDGDLIPDSEDDYPDDRSESKVVGGGLPLFLIYEVIKSN